MKKRIRDADDFEISYLDPDCVVVAWGNEFYIGIERENGTVVTKFFLEKNDDIVVEVEWDREQETFVVKPLTR